MGLICPNQRGLLLITYIETSDIVRCQVEMECHCHPPPEWELQVERCGLHIDLVHTECGVFGESFSDLHSGVSDGMFSVLRAFHMPNALRQHSCSPAHPCSNVLSGQEPNLPGPSSLWSRMTAGIDLAGCIHPEAMRWAMKHSHTKSEKL